MGLENWTPMVDINYQYIVVMYHGERKDVIVCVYIYIYIFKHYYTSMYVARVRYGGQVKHETRFLFTTYILLHEAGQVVVVATNILQLVVSATIMVHQYH